VKASQSLAAILLAGLLIVPTGTALAAEFSPDVGVVTILAPPDTVDSATTIIPRAVVRNYGSQDSSFRVIMRIGGLYSMLAFDTLRAGQSDTVSFLPWTAFQIGYSPVLCYTILAGDSNPANDTMIDSVYVRRPTVRDVGCVSILSPTGVVDSGTSILPAVVVRNSGLLAQTFPVTLRIGSNYEQTIQDTVAALTTDTATFPNWTAFPISLLPVVSFTSLVDDERPSNDTVRGNVQVLAPAQHDIGAVAIISPGPWARAGETIYPVVRIRNHGPVPEQDFQVRFRIGASYNRTSNVPETLPPDSTTIVTFAPWIAIEGRHAVSCSTLLSTDANPANDRVTSAVEVTNPPVLVVDADQSGSINTGDSGSWRFHAELQGGNPDVVELDSLKQTPGWRVAYYDSADKVRLTDTDADGRPDLGLVDPGSRRYFCLRVRAPEGLVGDTAMLSHARLTPTGFLAQDTAVRDSATLTLKLVPEVEVHNFPNPFSNKTRFILGVPEEGRITLAVYDRTGACVSRLFRGRTMSQGVHQVEWVAVNDHDQPVAPGTYEYMLEYQHAGKLDRVRKKLVVSKE